MLGVTGILGIIENKSSLKTVESTSNKVDVSFSVR